MEADDAAPAPAAAAAPATAPPSSSSALDLGTCTSSELSSYLLTRRFDDDAVKTAAFFLECAASLPDAGAISDAFLSGGGGGEGTERKGDAPAAAAGVPVISPTPAGPGARRPSEDDDVEELRRRIGDPLHLSSRPGSPELAPVEVSSVSPRGRFILKLHERGFTLTNPKKPNEKSEKIVVTSDSLTEDGLALVFPRPEKCSSKLKVVTKKGKKVPEELVRLLLIPLETFCEEGEAVTFRSKVLRQVCLPLPVGQRLPGEDEAEAVDGTKGSATLEETDWIEAFRTSLSGDTGEGGDGEKGPRRTRMVQIDYPQCRGAVGDTRKRGFVFRSDGPSTNPRMPFVGCYHGVNQGSLFPLEEGLLYFKPPLFLPRSDLRSIGCGRGSTGGGGSTSRYVDMHITLHGHDGGDDDADLEEEDAHETVEFTNISRDELNPLSNYIDNVLTPAMARDASSAPSPDGGGHDGDGGDEGPEEEDVETSSSVGDGTTRRRSRREASAHAREATRAHILASNAARRRRNPQEEEDADDNDDDSEEGEEDYNVEDDMDSDEDEDHVIDEDDDDFDEDDDDVDEDNRLGDNGKESGEDDDDEDEDFNDKAVDDDETVSDDSGSDDESEDDPPMKKARKD